VKPTWASLAPILHGAEVDEEAAWSVVLAHHDFVSGAVRRVILKAADVIGSFDGRVDAAVGAASQWVAERLVRRAVGDREPRDESPRGSAPRWLFVATANLARDWVKGQRRRLRREYGVADLAGLDDGGPPIVWDDAALRKLQRLIDHPERAGVPETHVLAYLCIYRPDALTEEIVRRAHDYVPSAGSRSGKPGLQRTVEETWALLQAWRERHGADTFTAAARAELAWVLRSDDTGPAETWRNRERRGARTATVTIGKWAIRCADVLTLPRK
jgi:hypothetical protein